MKFSDNDHLFRYSDTLQQELQLMVVESDVYFDLWVPITNTLLANVFNERDLEVMLDSVGCIDHPA
jgi:hypothetical protein